MLVCIVHSSETSKYHDREVGFKLSLTNNLLRMLSLSDRQLSTGDEENIDMWGYFNMLPVCKIFISGLLYYNSQNSARHLSSNIKFLTSV